MRFEKVFVPAICAAAFLGAAMPISASANETSPYTKMQKTQAQGEQQNDQVMQGGQMPMQGGQMKMQKKSKGATPPMAGATPETDAD